MLALLMPGQGSQSQGMLSPWLNEENKKELAKWSLHIDLDLERLGSVATNEEIKDTANAQPLIVATTLISAKTLGLRSYQVVAGHSVGEIAATALSGVLSNTDALELVRSRGLAMAKAASQSTSGMAAILGGQKGEVLSVLEQLGLVAANDNGGGQLVAAGELAALDKLAENPPKDSRIRPLAVAGAFHSQFMQSAVSQVEEFVTRLQISDPKAQLLSNKDGKVVTTGKDAIARIVNQIANPVRWDLCMESLIELGVTGAIELAPAGTLVGLLKRATPTIETFALKDPDEITAAREFARKHGGA